MPGQLLHLRLLLSPSAVTLRRAIAFSPRGLVRTSRGLSRTCRAFSARPEPSARASDRLRRGSAGGQARSLVDDEADLSDWVGDLKMDSFQSGRGGDLDRRSGVGGRSGWRAPVDGQRRGRDSGDDFGSMFDRRKGPSGDMRGRGRGRGRRSFLGSNLNDTDEADDDDDDEVRGYGGGRNRGRGMIGVRSRGGREREWRGGGVSRRGGGGGRRGGFEGGYRSREVRREEKPLDMGRRSGHDRKKVSFVSEDEEGEEDGGFGFASIMEKREKRKSEAGWHNGNRGAKRSNFLMSEEEEDDDDDFELASPLAKTNGRLEPRDRMRMSRKPMDDDDFGFTLPQTKGGVGRLGEVEAPGSFKDDVDEDDDEFDEKLDTDGGLLLEGEEEGEGGEMVEATEVEPAVRSHSKARLEEVDSYLSNSRFDECQLSPLSLKGVKAAGYERMTMVQEATLPIILKGKDVLAKAKTGTGKTVAFLLPAIEILVKQPPVDRDQQKPPIYVLVICPTRELANQAAMEAEKLLKFHPYVGAQCVTGGIRLALEQKRMQANPCQILVATPGRLRDHIENTAGFATRLKGVKVLVLDEADHLLDMGFRKDIEKIIASVPSQRQTLLFSATVPTEVRQVCHIALRRDHEYINTVEEGGEETHAQVKQAVMIAPLDKQFPLLYHLLKNHVADDVDYKVLIFCVTAMVTRLVAELLTEMKLNVREIHSRKSQAYRTRVSDEFRKSKGLILVTSDVSARGVDYPDVTLVIQLGLPADREQYIHRLGRTGRKGKEGQGILLLAPWEEYFLSSIKDLPISKLPSPSVDQDTTAKVKHALDYVEMKDKESAYQAWLGYYKSNKAIARDTSRLVELANEFSRSMGLDTPPAISKLVLGKMGLRNVPGLRSK